MTLAMRTAVVTRSFRPGSVYARSPISRETVKPMPARTDAPAMSGQVSSGESRAKPSRTEAHAPPRTPMTLPASRPIRTPSATRSVNTPDSVAARKVTPAARNAKAGTAIPATQGRM
jgi:hypothetical protein